MKYAYPESMFRAISLAVSLHRDQCRKDTQDPYVTHCFDVYKTLSNWGIRGNKHRGLLEVAMLHDAVEDAEDIPSAKHLILVALGEEILLGVMELTHIPEESSKEVYMASFDHKSLDALLIKAADRICNVRDYMASSPAYARKYFAKADSLFQALEKRRLLMESEFGTSVVLGLKQSYDELRAKLGINEPLPSGHFF